MKVSPYDDVQHGDGVDDVEAGNNVRRRPETLTANELERYDEVPFDDSARVEPENKYK